MNLDIALVEPEIHWNTGNAGRTCLAVGARLHLIPPLGFSLDDKEIRRSGLDYWVRVPLTVWPDWAHFESELPQLGEPFFFSTEGTRPYWDVAYPGRTVLIFGRESVGLPAELRERYRDRLVRIPQEDPQLRSINLSTCIGIAAFEVRRQWEKEEARRRDGPTGS